ncbi:MAG: sugar ABC transporter substrate-binding protein [Christensenellales bacterium]|jgi:ribose transport system substrate-binding protein
MKKLVCLIIALMLTLSFAACGAPDGTTDTPDSGGGPQTTQETGTDAQADNKPAIDIPFGPTAGKTDADYQFGFSFGGINPYADPVEPAATVAEAELGIKKHLLISTPQDWVQNDQNQLLDALISGGCKGIFMMPSEATASNEQITKMVNAGIPVVCMGGAPELPSDATLTLATDVYTSAYEGTKAVIEAIGGKGNIVGLTGALNDTNTQKRLKAIEDACNEYPGVELFQTLADIDNSEASMTAVGDLLAASGDEIGGMISTAYYPSVAMAKYLGQEEYNHIKGVGIDTDSAVLDAIREGSLYGTMSQNPWGQSYIGIYTLKMLIDGYTYKDGQPEVIDSGSFLVTAENIDEYDNLKMQVTNEILSTWLDRFDAPAK